MTTAFLPADDKQRGSVLRVLFVTLFLDLIGFSIIFPLFPEMLTHYTSTQPDNFILKSMLGLISSFLSMNSNAPEIAKIVLFGGLLSSLYSILQFFFAPVWGRLSDRIGRKPVLFITVCGLGLSYLMWAFAGSFTFLILARLIGGMMAGNISTATAAVSDITDEKTRSRGMAVIGIAFGLGFIIGPAIGGISSLLDLSATHPEWISYGINPFSMPAFIAFALSLLNLFLIAKIFPETLSHANRAKASDVQRTANPLKLFKPLPYENANRANLAYFVFLLAFSGMEFTLTFLARERFGYTPRNNANMFVFVGLIMALVQGGVVRRHAHSIGEKRLTMIGLLFIMPGLLAIGWSQTVSLLYVGLALLAIGAAFVTPCLTSLSSLSAPPEAQGMTMGVFRSLGALSRALGPLLACVIYWRFDASNTYMIGALSIIVPLILVSQIRSMLQTAAA